MRTRIFALAFAVLAWLRLDTSAAENAADPALDAEIVRFLTALEFGEDAKAVYAEAISKGEIDKETARVLARITERRFVDLAVPALRPLVSLDEAKEMADFYTSDVMREMLAEQKRTGSGAPVARNQKQAEAVQKFVGSKAGQAALRLQKVLVEPEFQDKFTAALEEELQKE